MGRLPRLDLDRVRSVLALFLFTSDDVYKKISMLSGGEKGRVSLCKLMLKRDNLLLLDEPTNHLDMDSREVLEGALEDFDGTILTVSHDRYFINRVADRIIEMRPDGVKEYLGNYDDYLEKKRREEAGLEDAAASGMTKTQLDKQRRRSACCARAKRRWKSSSRPRKRASPTRKRKFRSWKRAWPTRNCISARTKRARPPAATPNCRRAWTRSTRNGKPSRKP